MKRSVVRYAVSSLLIGVLLAAGPVSSLAQQPSDSVAALEALTSQVAAELRCPVCQGLSIQDSPTELALEMRAVIRDQLAEGRSPEEVKEYFVSKYGEWILMEPKAEGFNLAVYVLPVVGLIAGATFVFFTARKWVRQGGAAELAEEEAAEEEARARIA